MPVRRLFYTPATVQRVENSNGPNFGRLRPYPAIVADFTGSRGLISAPHRLRGLSPDDLVDGHSSLGSRQPAALEAARRARPAV
jgi:hypothetical protein